MKMTVRTRQHRSRTRRRLGRRAALAAAVPAVTITQSRERDAGGPEDRACYSCTCGYVFEASVSTTVGCPHCGSAQAW
jgi:hypothetical protein